MNIQDAHSLSKAKSEHDYSGIAKRSGLGRLARTAYASVQSEAIGLGGAIGLPGRRARNKGMRAA
jgi:hypothetical protein